ncbi:hypothetical protein D3C87_1834540 [compost metagenome]
MELGDDAVTGSAENATAMLGDEVADRGAIGAQRRKRTFLVGRDEATIASDIGSEDDCELPFQGGKPLLRRTARGN